MKRRAFLKTLAALPFLGFLGKEVPCADVVPEGWVRVSDSVSYFNGDPYLAHSLQQCSDHIASMVKDRNTVLSKHPTKLLIYGKNLKATQKLLGA